MRESTRRLLDEMLGELTPGQTAGTVCLLCGIDATEVDLPHVPLIHPGTLGEVYSATGAPVMVCEDLLRCAVRKHQGDRSRPPVTRLRIGRRVLLLVIAGLVFATLVAVIAVSAGREPLPMDPGTPSTVTTIGGPR